MPQATSNITNRRFSLTGLFAWIVVGACVITAAFRYRLAGEFSEYWPLFSILVAIGLIINGQLGAGLGLSQLFRDEERTTTNAAASPALFFGRSFLGGLGTMLLTITVWMVVFYCDLWRQAYHNPSSRDIWIELLYANRAARIGAHQLLYDRHGVVIANYWFVEARFVLLGTLLCFAPILLCIIFRAGETKLRRSNHQIVAFIAGGATMILVAAACMVIAHQVATNPFTNEVGSNVFKEEFEEQLVKGINNVTVNGPDSDAIRQALAADGRFLNPGFLDRYRVFTVTGITIFLVFFTAVYVLILWRIAISPGLGLCMVLCLLALAYLGIALIPRQAQFLVIAVAALWVVLCNSRKYKLRLPNLKNDYLNPVPLETVNQNADRAASHLLNDLEVLTSWRNRFQDKPKLILVATSGGAYRSAFWTTIVLDRLAREIDGFSRNVRLITGASGGMVGAAYMAASADQNGAATNATELLQRDATLKGGLGPDSLTPLMRQFVRHDLFLGAVPCRLRNDRGRVLEDCWKSLDVTFQTLCEGESEGWRPSLIISPTFVESGRRLLFSNLDLYGLTTTSSKSRRGVSFGPGDGMAQPPTGAHSLYSRSAIEFFRIFPQAHSAFRLKTAVRMNATFPYISPAVSLPVDPPRRLVDAGYYDNYGVNLAMSWAYLNRNWIAENTSGLGLIQLRAFESEVVRKELWGSKRLQSNGLFANLIRGVGGLTAPPTAAMNSLSWSMSFRNDEQIRAIDEFLNYPPHGPAVVNPAQPRFFETFIFEDPVPFGMNWFLTLSDIEKMQETLKTDCAPEVQRLADWWNHRPKRPPARAEALKVCASEDSIAEPEREAGPPES